ncbi:MAG: NAD-dependent epimerase/dehydratase family protein [Acidimicrobiia bacterium]
MSRVLVTGGAGWFGHHLALSLVATGWAVRVLDIASRPEWADGLDVDYVQGDVCDPERVRGALRGVSAVVHSAFAPPGATIEQLRRVNVGGTRALMDAALRTEEMRVVLISSTIVDRDLKPHPLLAEGPATRLWRYARTRAEAESEAASFTEAGLPVAVVRPKTFLGPGGVGPFALVFDLIKGGRTVPMLGPGRNRYQLVDVRDLAAGVALLAKSEVVGRFGFGAADMSTVAAEMKALLDHAGTGARILPVPGPVGRAGLRAVALAGLPTLSEWHYCLATGEDSVIDIRRATAELGWLPERSNIDALVDAFDWYASEAEGATPPRGRPVPASHRALGRLAAAVPAGRASRQPRRPRPR